MKSRRRQGNTITRLREVLNKVLPQKRKDEMIRETQSMRTQEVQDV